MGARSKEGCRKSGMPGSFLKQSHTCPDPGSFVRGGPTLTFSWREGGGGLVDEGREDKWAIIGPPVKCHLNGVSLAGRCWPKIEYWLGSFLIFQGIKTSIAKKPYIFVIFQGVFVCLFDLILYVHSTIFQLCGTSLPGLNQY